MDRYVALVVYGCTIAGEASGSVDVQVRVVDADSVEGVEQELRAEPIHEYENEYGESVSWPLVSVLDVKPLSAAAESGTEVAGAIFTLAELEQHLPGRTVHEDEQR